LKETRDSKDKKIPLQISCEQHLFALCTTMHPGGGGIGISGQILNLQITTVFLHLQKRQGSFVGTCSSRLYRTAWYRHPVIFGKNAKTED